MIAGGLWRSRRQQAESVHQWRPRRSCRGELVQWDTSAHDWLEGRGEKLYLINMIDDATSELTARLVRHDSTEENMRLLWSYLEKHGRPVAFYTDKVSLFQTAPKVRRDEKQLPREEREPLPPTQIGRALRELGITWIAAHSPQSKGRVERSFGTAQERLVKGLRVARRGRSSRPTRTWSRSSCPGGITGKDAFEFQSSRTRRTAEKDADGERPPQRRRMHADAPQPWRVLPDAENGGSVQSYGAIWDVSAEGTNARVAST